MGMWFSSRRRSDAYRDASLPGHTPTSVSGRSRLVGLPHDVSDSFGDALSHTADEDERRSLAALLRGSCGDRANEVASRLLQRFETTGAVLSASAGHLLAALPDETAVVDQLGLVRATLHQALRSRLCRRPLLSDESSLIEYLTFTMAYTNTENFRVLFLDVRNCLIRDEVVASGSVRGVVVHPREIMRRSIELGATALILVHNHPSGDPTPSRADIITSQRVAAAAEVMGVHLHDHLIVARSGASSLKRLGHLA